MIYFEITAEVVELQKAKNLIILLGSIALLAGCQQVAHQKQSISSSQGMSSQQAIQADVIFGLAQTQPTANLPQLKMGDQTIYYSPSAVLKRNDLLQVTPLKAKNGTSYLRFQLNQDGTAKLASLTSQNNGRMLLLVINNRVRGMSKIVRIINNGVLDTIVASDEAAQNIVNEITDRTRPSSVR